MTLRFIPQLLAKNDFRKFAKIMLHYEVAKLRKNKKPSILRSWEFLDTTGVSAMKNDPNEKIFRSLRRFAEG